MKKPKGYSQAGPVVVRDLKTGRIKRVDAPMPGGLGPGDTLKWWKGTERRERRVDD